jgi:thiamine-monophosphate kinase
MTGSSATMTDLGEKGFLARLLPGLSVDARFVNGFGHDASVIDLGLEHNLVMKIDRAATPIASLNGWADYRVWGRIAVTANCSDILTVGGEPKGFMLSLSIAPDTPASIAEEIIRGAAEECERCDVAFLGGDTKEAIGLNIVGSAIGTIPKGRHHDRRQGHPGDLLVLAGQLGGFLGGYRQCASQDPSGEALRYLCEPSAAWREARALSQIAGIRSACDLSDGLASSVGQVVAAGAGAVLDFASLPFHGLAISNAARRGADILNYAFGVGDWGIVYAIAPEDKAQIEGLRLAGLAIAIVGTVVDEPGLFLKRGGLFAISIFENEHFRRRMEDQGSYFDELEAGLELRPIEEQHGLA